MGVGLTGLHRCACSAVRRSDKYKFLMPDSNNFISLDLISFITIIVCVCVCVCGHVNYPQMSRGMRFPTMWYVRLAKAQTRLRIRAD